MPELPEVETVRRGLEPILRGRRLVHVKAHRPDLRFPLPVGFVRALRGRLVLDVDRRGKFLLIRLEGEMVWIAHLGMSGRFHAHDGAAGTLAVPPAELHDHVEVSTDDGWCVRFRDPRRFGFMDLCPGPELAAHSMLARLGPEPLTPAFDPTHLARCLAGRTASIKACLLDQRVVAGLGNIYVCESLFRARLSPSREAGAVRGRHLDRLVAAIKAVLNEAIAEGGSSLRDHRRPSGEVGTFQDGFAVYGRAGEACPGCTCDVAKTGGVQRMVQTGRSTFHCPRRQR